MERGVGEFLIEGMPLASLASREHAKDERVVRALNAAYTLGKQRTVHQDAAYGIRQLVDVALKALSPGVNDTTTATNCIDYLGAILARMIDRQIEEPYRSDGRSAAPHHERPDVHRFAEWSMRPDTSECGEQRRRARATARNSRTVARARGATSSEKTPSCSRQPLCSKRRTAAYPRRMIVRQYKLHSMLQR